MSASRPMKFLSARFSKTRVTRSNLKKNLSPLSFASDVSVRFGNHPLTHRQTPSSLVRSPCNCNPCTLPPPIQSTTLQADRNELDLTQASSNDLGLCLRTIPHSFALVRNQLSNQQELLFRILYLTYAFILFRYVSHSTNLNL